jgi:hypothetical protein
MGKVIAIEVVRNERRLTEQEAWQAFVDHMRRSKETLRIEDGIAAGKAYREFLELYGPRK